jgi:PilZ domain
MERLEVSRGMPPFLPRLDLPLDRRKHKRYQFKQGALLSPVACERKYWKMLDVSMGGVSFRYIPSEDLTASTEIDIVMRDLEFVLEGLPYKVISDGEFTDGLSSLKLRRCGVQLGPLTHLQESLLGEFIRTYTAAVPMD